MEENEDEHLARFGLFAGKVFLYIGAAMLAMAAIPQIRRWMTGTADQVTKNIKSYATPQTQKIDSGIKSNVSGQLRTQRKLDVQEDSQDDDLFPDPEGQNGTGVK